MKYLILITMLVTLISCGGSNTTGSASSSSSASTSVMTANNFKTLSSISSLLKGTWSGYEANGTPIEITIVSASNTTVTRFSETVKEQVAADQNNYYVITDSKNSSYWHISNATTTSLYLYNANNQSLILNKE